MSYVLLAAGLLLAIGFGGWRAGRRTRFFLHLLQLDGYKRHEYTTWIRDNRRGLLIRLSHVLALVVLVSAFQLAAAGRPALAAAVALVSWPIVFASSRRYRRTHAKKPLVATPRMRRLVACTAVLSAAITLAPPLVDLASRGDDGFGVQTLLLFLAGLGLADLLAPLVVWIAAAILAPFESRIQEGFKKRARARLAQRPELLIVAVTGSYGKTSTKAAIAAVLGNRQEVLASPGSYNTPMGLCRVINDMLTARHQAIVLEMGARYLGDIQELCDLVTPNIGVVTSVGVAHLETMGSVEAIAREKGTLPANVPDSGTVVLNADDPAVLAMRERTSARVLTAGTSPDADIRATNIAYGTDGSSFDVIDETGERCAFHTAVLGRHNVQNILLAVAVGRAVGLRLREMAHAVKGMPAVEHRLRLRREGDLLILDDAFNSNPVGARNALDILAGFDGGRRIVITPGMVELGERHEIENKAFGAHMAGRADIVMLVGRNRTRPIRDGLLEAGFPEDRIHVFASLAEAQNHLRSIQQRGDTVLYENDLPDHYEEAA